MSDESVEIVRRFNAPYDGEDVIPTIMANLAELGADPSPDAVLALWARDPAWQVADSEIEWDVSAGVFGSAARGPVELAEWWASWAETWESYSYRIIEYRDLGDWVLTPADIEARGREGIPINARTFQLWRVKDGRIVLCRVFLSEAEALAAIGEAE